MDESIDAWALDVGGPDARLVAGVLKLHRRTGGSLAASLENLAGTLRDRRASARELGSLTAQARLSATILRPISRHRQMSSKRFRNPWATHLPRYERALSDATNATKWWISATWLVGSCDYSDTWWQLEARSVTS
jgi:hypothetical protein